MADKKISALETIVTVDTGTDLFPIVDSSAGVTKKITPTALKTALSLDNVNNTSDLNKPISTATQDALDNRVIENAPITPGTAPKITFDAKGLVTIGDSLDETDLPTGINANKIGTGVVSTTEFEYLNGVTSAIQTQLNSKQATLVSGTNIKTINGATVLGAGDITIAGNPPSGVSGAIQFSNGSAFASDAANFFWDDTNNRLGVGTNTPQSKTEINSTGNQLWITNSSDIYTYLKFSAAGGFASMIFGDGNGTVNFLNNYASGMWASNKFAFGSSYFAPSGQVHIKGSGSTSATTSLLVQNSAGTPCLTITDNILTTIRRQLTITDSTGANNAMIVYADGLSGVRTLYVNGSVGLGVIGNDASARLQVDSTTQGVLFPRMTTTQKNAIAAVAGLVVYDNTTNKLCCYNGSTWNDLF
jgi:hypothetical protein